MQRFPLPLSENPFLTCPTPGLGTTDVTITGGTGIFEGAGGMFVLDVQFLGQEFDPDTNTLTTNYVYAASGTISY
jgi:hypothetical protein